MKRAVLLAMVAVLVSGCVAAHPDSIKPASVSPIGYQAIDCAGLAAEDKRVAEALFRLEVEQKSARTGDIVGIVAIGVSPTGLGAQNNTAEIARLKGERQAIAGAKTGKGCAEPPAAVDEMALRRQMTKERVAKENAS